MYACGICQSLLQPPGLLSISSQAEPAFVNAVLAVTLTDRPHQLQPVLGEPVSRVANRDGLRAHAGVRLHAANTNCARAQVWMLRERLLKLGAHVVASVRRIVIHLPASFPFLPAFGRIAISLGAQSG
jgi:hypothetical protein